MGFILVLGWVWSSPDVPNFVPDIKMKIFLVSQNNSYDKKLSNWRTLFRSILTTHKTELLIFQSDWYLDLSALYRNLGNTTAHFVINMSAVLQIKIYIFGYNLNTISIICCRNRFLLQVACCDRLTENNKQNCHRHTSRWHCWWQLLVEPSSQYTHLRTFRLLLIVDVSDDTFL